MSLSDKFLKKQVNVKDVFSSAVKATLEDLNSITLTDMIKSLAKDMTEDFWARGAQEVETEVTEQMFDYDKVYAVSGALTAQKITEKKSLVRLLVFMEQQNKKIHRELAQGIIKHIDLKILYLEQFQHLKAVFNKKAVLVKCIYCDNGEIMSTPYDDDAPPEKKRCPYCLGAGCQVVEVV